MLSVHHTQWMGTKNLRVPEKMEGEDEFLNPMQTQLKTSENLIIRHLNKVPYCDIRNEALFTQRH